MDKIVLATVPTLGMSVLSAMSRNDGRSQTLAAHTRRPRLRVASKEPAVRLAILQLHVEFLSANYRGVNRGKASGVGPPSLHEGAPRSPARAPG